MMMSTPTQRGEGVEFLGEYSKEEFITYNTLATSVGLTGRVGVNEKYFRIRLDGTELVIPLEHVTENDTSWNQMNSANLIYGNRITTIKDKYYKVRLIKSRTTNGVFDYNLTEYGRVYFFIVKNPFKSDFNLVYQGPRLPTYTEAELISNYSRTSIGKYWLCQETISGNATHLGAWHIGYGPLMSAVSSPNMNTPWRPVLELISD